MTPPDDHHQDLLSAIGKAIRLRRVELDLSRADLAREALLSYAYVSEIENGTKQASSKALWRLAHALGLEPHELLTSAAQWEARPAPPVPLAPIVRALGVPRALALDDPSRSEPQASDTTPRAAGRAGWFHEAVAPERAAALASGRGAAGPTAESPVARSEPVIGTATVTGAPELLEVLGRIAGALDGVPDERAELALMLSLDERRTRRIVREELDRRR